MNQNIYRGHKNGLVTVNDDLLDPRTDVITHSINGFSWGVISSSGPSQLALAIMLYEFGEDFDDHPCHYMDLKKDLLDGFEQHRPFCLSSAQIEEWVHMKRACSNTRVH